MKLHTVKALLDAKVVCNERLVENEVNSACGCDLMSDVLAYVKDQGMLLTGLNNLQAIRTAEMMDMRCVVFVRGKVPDDAMLELAKQTGIVLMSTNYTLYTSCGILYNNGLPGGGMSNGR